MATKLCASSATKKAPELNRVLMYFQRLVAVEVAVEVTVEVTVEVDYQK